MLRPISRSLVRCDCARRRCACRDRAGKRAAEGRADRQCLQLDRLCRSGGTCGFHQGDRHQGPLRHLRFQRHPGDQAARRKVRLRRRGADRLFPGAPDQGRRVPEARQGEAAQSGQPLAGNFATARRLRSGQSVRRELHVGHDRHRLQRQEGARNSRARRQDRQLGHRLQARQPRPVQGMRRPHARCRRRHLPGGAAPISGSTRTPPKRPTCRRPPI